MNYKRICIVLSVYLLGCTDRISDESVRRYGPAFNTVREQYHLPIIADEMLLTTNRDNLLTWFSNAKVLDSLCYYCKYIEVSNSKIKREDSYIAGIQKYKSFDGIFVEKLIITSKFNEMEIPISTQYSFRNMENEAGEYISKIAADSLLKLWKIEIYK